MADEKNKKPLTKEEKLNKLRTKVNKIAATMLLVVHSDLQMLVQVPAIATVYFRAAAELPVSDGALMVSPSPALAVTSSTSLQPDEDLLALVAALPTVSPAASLAPALPSMEMKLELPPIAPALPVVDTSPVLQPFLEVSPPLICFITVLAASPIITPNQIRSIPVLPIKVVLSP
jgi:hypothetical protein